ncbi:MAG: 3-oxoacyl-ACP reductase FabG [Bacilli bacterium]|nr:3-oxoacyl-ACP reductase FabG [Bacilli bacterium]
MSKTVVLVTGSNRGIGAACIKAFAEAGANVVINYCHHEEEALRLKQEVEKEYNVEALVIKCDVSDNEQVENMVNEIVDYYGGIDILVNNAGVSRDSLLLDKTVKEFKRVLDVNLLGTYLCSKYVGKVMLNQKKGKIINISSTNAIDTFYPESCDYDASKAGVISLTHNLAREFAPFINVNCVCPGWTKTNMNKDLSLDQINEEKRKILLNRFANPEEIANVVLFLSSQKANYINDAIIRVDGGKYNG